MYFYAIISRLIYISVSVSEVEFQVSGRVRLFINLHCCEKYRLKLVINLARNSDYSLSRQTCHLKYRNGTPKIPLDASHGPVSEIYWLIIVPEIAFCVNDAEA